MRHWRKQSSSSVCHTAGGHGTLLSPTRHCPVPVCTLVLCEPLLEGPAHPISNVNICHGSVRTTGTSQGPRSAKEPSNRLLPIREMSEGSRSCSVSGIMLIADAGKITISFAIYSGSLCQSLRQSQPYSCGRASILTTAAQFCGAPAPADAEDVTPRPCRAPFPPAPFCAALFRFYLEALMARGHVFCPGRWSVAAVSQVAEPMAPS